MKKSNSLPELHAGDLLLRQLRHSDVESIIYLRSDEVVNRYVQRPKAENKEQALAFIDRIGNEVAAGKSFYWCISEKGSPEMIGSISLWNFSEDRKTAEVGYDLSVKFHGKGIMDTSLKEVLKFGFEKLDLNKIEAFTQKNNKTSIRLLERNDFKLNSKRSDPDNPENSIFELFSKGK